MHPGGVFADLRAIQRVKQHIRAGRKNPLLMFPQMDQADPGDHLMAAALEARQHGPGLRQAARFPQNLVVQKHQRVGAQHQRIGNLLGNGKGLPVGIKLADFQGGEMLIGHLGHVGRHDLKIHLEQPQQFRAAGRSRGQNDGRQFHIPILAGIRELSRGGPAPGFWRPANI